MMTVYLLSVSLVKSYCAANLLGVLVLGTFDFCLASKSMK